jgi:hypothetical protein
MAHRLLILTNILLTLEIGVGTLVHRYLRENNGDIEEDEIHGIGLFKHDPSKTDVQEGEIDGIGLFEHLPRHLQARKMSSFAAVHSKTITITARLMMEKKEFPAPMFVSIAKTDDDPPEYKFIKGIAVQEDGSYELLLRKIRAGKYYLKFRHNEEAYGEFIERGDSHVNSKGNSDKQSNTARSMKLMPASH